MPLPMGISICFSFQGSALGKREALCPSCKTANHDASNIARSIIVESIPIRATWRDGFFVCLTFAGQARKGKLDADS